MIFYFSGVRSNREASLLLSAGITDVLVDPASYRNLAPDLFPRMALDSGAYAAFKAGRVLSTKEYLSTLSGLPLAQFDWLTCNDVIGNPGLTRAHWDELNALGLVSVPVWQWGSPVADLSYFLDNSPIVGLGGLVPVLRDRRDERLNEPDKKAWNKCPEKVLAELLKIVTANPNRFHLFGLCWVKAFNVLSPYLLSADSSLWLNGRKYGLAIFINARSGKLALAPKGMIPACKELSSDELCAYNAQQISLFTKR